MLLRALRQITGQKAGDMFYVDDQRGAALLRKMPRIVELVHEAVAMPVKTEAPKPPAHAITTPEKHKKHK